MKLTKKETASLSTITVETLCDSQIGCEPSVEILRIILNITKQMATGTAQKSKRAHSKTKARRAINYAMRLRKDDFTAIIISEFSKCIELAKTAVEELMDIHETYMGTMEADGKSQE